MHRTSSVESCWAGGLIFSQSDRSRSTMLNDFNSVVAMVASAAGAAAYTLNEEGTILVWTNAAEELFGYSSDEMVGSTVYKLIPDSHRESFGIFASQMNYQPFIRARSLRRSKCGDVFLAEICAIRLQATISGATFAVVVRNLNRTEHKQSDASLAASIVESSSDAIASVGPAGEVLTWNAAATRLFGFSADEMIGNSMLPLFPVARRWAFGMGATELAKGRPLMHDTTRLHKDGHEIPVSLVASPLIDESGAYLGYSVMFRTQADQTQSLAAVRNAERFNQRVLEASRDWVSIINTAGEAMYINPAGLAMLGFEQDPSVHRARWISFWPESEQGLIAAHLAQAVNGIETRFDGQITPWTGAQYAFDVTITPIKDDEGNVVRVVAVAHDETEKRRQREHLDVVVKELSHRVKNTLAVISGMSRSPVTEGTDIETYQASFHARIRSLARSHDLLVGMDWRGLDVDDLLRSQTGGFGQGVADRRFSFHGPRMVFKPEPAQMLGLAFHELATNASKYGALSKPDGRLEVTWSRHLTEEGIEAFEFRWQEFVTGTSVPSGRSGFGSEVLTEIVAEMLNGTSELLFEPTGVSWTLSIPDLTHIVCIDD